MSKSKTKTLQTTNVPISYIELGDKMAKEQGFNTLHDAIRMFVRQYSGGYIKFDVSLREISPEREAQYEKDHIELMKEIKEGKRKVYTDVNSMMKDLLNDKD